MKRSSGWLAVAVLLVLVGAGVAAGTGGPPPLPADGGFVPLIGCTNKKCTMPDGCPGVMACDGNGGWLPCDYTGASKSCTACGQTGYQTCPVTDNVCHVTTLTQACGSGGCGGTQSCNAVPGGAWNSCVCPTQYTCHTTAGDLCGTTGSISCNGSCQPTTTTCTVNEVCNNCDDNGDGNVDEGLHCSCGL